MTDLLAAAVQAMSDASAREQGIKTLAETLRALEKIPAETPVVFDDGRHPGGVDSYRGYYERLAIEPTTEPTTVGDLVKTLDAADGETFHGYKGGEYRMHGGTYLHVAPHGVCGRALVGVALIDGVAVIQTKDEEF